MCIRNSLKKLADSEKEGDDLQGERDNLLDEAAKLQKKASDSEAKDYPLKKLAELATKHDADSKEKGELLKRYLIHI